MKVFKSLLALFVVGTLLSSCSMSSHTACPAYADVETESNQVISAEDEVVVSR